MVQEPSKNNRFEPPGSQQIHFALMTYFLWLAEGLLRTLTQTSLRKLDERNTGGEKCVDRLKSNLNQPHSTFYSPIGSQRVSRIGQPVDL